MTKSKKRINNVIVKEAITNIPVAANIKSFFLCFLMSALILLRSLLLFAFIAVLAILINISQHIFFEPNDLRCSIVRS